MLLDVSLILDKTPYQAWKRRTGTGAKRKILPSKKVSFLEAEQKPQSYGVLHRKYFDHGTEIYQLILSQQFRAHALKGTHDEVSQLGVKCALSLILARFYCANMAKAIEERCQTCERCFRRKARPQKAAPMQNMQTIVPLELVCMDYL